MYKRQLQHGSRKGHGCPDAITTLQLLREHNGKDLLCVASLDLSKAYDRVHRPTLWKRLSKLGVNDHLLECITSTYSNYYGKVSIGKKSTKDYSLENGLRQGSVLSPVLFIAFMDTLLKELENSGIGISVPGAGKHNKVPGIMYVDDLCLVTNNLEDLNSLITLVTMLESP